MLRSLFLVLILNSLIFCDKLFPQLSFTYVPNPWVGVGVYLFDGHQIFFDNKIFAREFNQAGGFANLNVKRSFELKDSTIRIGKGARVGASAGFISPLIFILPVNNISVPITNFQVEIGFKISSFREVEFAFNKIYYEFPFVNRIDGRALKVGIRFNSSGNFLNRFISFQAGPIWIDVAKRFQYPRSWRYKLRGIYSNIDFGYSLTSKLGIGGYIAIRLGCLLRMLKRDEISTSGGLSVEIQSGFHWYFKNKK